MFNIIINIKKSPGSIKITAFSGDRVICFPLTVDINMTSAQLITLINQCIQSVSPEKVKNGFFLYITIKN